MGVALAVVAIAAMLAVVAFIVLASIAAVVEILPPLGNRDADDRGAGMPVVASVHPRRWRSAWHARKPRTGFSH